MKLRLKENPKEWLKFTAVMALAVGILGGLLHWRKIVGREALLTAVSALVLVVAVCAARPKWFRGFYRAGMTCSFYFGQMMGAVILTAVFLLAVTPLGLLLRLSGKDLLRLKRNRSATTYWQSAKTSNEFDRLF